MTRRHPDEVRSVGFRHRGLGVSSGIPRKVTMVEREHESHEHVSSDRVVDRRAWSPGQIVAGLVGFALIVLGGIALARLGLSTPVTGEVTEVAGVSATRLWAGVEIVLGLILLGIAASPYAVRGGLVTMGLLFAAFGLVVAVEPDPFSEPLGVNSGSGIVLLVMGVVLVLVGWLSPTVISSQRRSAVTRDESDRIA